MGRDEKAKVRFTREINEVVENNLDTPKCHFHLIYLFEVLLQSQVNGVISKVL